jgi:hypothetical protein
MVLLAIKVLDSRMRHVSPIGNKVKIRIHLPSFHSFFPLHRPYAARTTKRISFNGYHKKYRENIQFHDLLIFPVQLHNQKSNWRGFYRMLPNANLAFTEMVNVIRRFPSLVVDIFLEGRANTTPGV